MDTGMASASSICPLPGDVVIKINSSIVIDSLNTVILELLKNSLDASSQKIDISVEYDRGNCTVEDDGLGILPSEFQPGGGLAKSYHPSEDHQMNTTHGSHRSFLASLVSLALVSITSHHHLHHSHNAMGIKHGEVVFRHTPTSQQQHLSSSKHGTRVIVRDLFGNMPVRVKQRAMLVNGRSAAAKEWDKLRKAITGLVLAWPARIILTVKSRDMDQQIRLRGSMKRDHVPRNLANSAHALHISNILWQAGYIPSPDKSSWITVAASTPRLSIQGAISLDPTPTKNAQFFSLGNHPVGGQDTHNIFAEEVNKLFSNSSFGTDDNLPDQVDEEKKRPSDARHYKADWYTTRNLKGSRKSIDRWPAFAINFEFVSENSRRKGDVHELVDGRADSLNSIISLLRAMIQEFLRSNKLMHKADQEVRLSQKSNIFRSGNHRSAEVPRIVAETSVREQTRHLTNSTNIAVLNPAKVSAVDILGIRVRLPSYASSGSPRTASPFDGWSRLKRGKDLGGIDSNTNCKGSDLSSGTQVVDAVPSSLARSPMSSLFGDRDLSDSNQCTIPKSQSIFGAVDKSGKLVRRPFAEISDDASRSSSDRFLDAIPISESGPTVADVHDEAVPWLDPMTRESSLVNIRTGVILKLPAALFGPDNHSIANHLTRIGRDKGSKQQMQEPGTWIRELLESWDNPVFSPTGISIPQLSMTSHDGPLQSILNSHSHECSPTDIDAALNLSFAGRLSKDGLSKATVIAQVDKKFILVKMSSTTNVSVVSKFADSNEMLVIVDQHAADERCRVEELLHELCRTPDVNNASAFTGLPRPGIFTAFLETPIIFRIPYREMQLLELHKQHFANWGILYELQKPPLIANREEESQIVVKCLPPGITEKCKLDPTLLIGLIRSEVWTCDEKQNLHCASHLSINGLTPHDHSESSQTRGWPSKIQDCPRAILDMLNSRSCRSAIMFNDELSINQCNDLLQRLSTCTFPFQCAHGRPSVIPLVSLGGSSQIQIPTTSAAFERKPGFAATFKVWKQKRLLAI